MTIRYKKDQKSRSVLINNGQMLVKNMWSCFLMIQVKGGENDLYNRVLLSLEENFILIESYLHRKPINNIVNKSTNHFILWDRVPRHILLTFL